MFLTVLFVILLFSKKENNYDSIHEKIDNENELFEIDNPCNYPHNPLYYENYWKIIEKQLFYFLIKSFVIVGFMCLDVLYIQYVYFN